MAWKEVFLVSKIQNTFDSRNSRTIICEKNRENKVLKQKMKKSPMKFVM